MTVDRNLGDLSADTDIYIPAKTNQFYYESVHKYSKYNKYTEFCTLSVVDALFKINKLCNKIKLIKTTVCI